MECELPFRDQRKVMNARDRERAAYIAAHRILSANLGAPELACPSARWTYAVDTVAGIIQEVFECQPSSLDVSATRTERAADTAAECLARRQNGILLELVNRASS
jgi:hypothetical protein